MKMLLGISLTYSHDIQIYEAVMLPTICRQDILYMKFLFYYIFRWSNKFDTKSFAIQLILFDISNAFHS